MTKSEFINTLRMQLQGELSQAQIEGHLHYYKEYIAQEVAAGRREQEVLDELGSPVLIAKTLLDTAENSFDGEETYRSQNDAGYYSDDFGDDPFEGTGIHIRHINPIILKWVVPISVIAVLFILLTLVGSVVAIGVRFFVPIMIIVLVFRLFNRK